MNFPFKAFCFLVCCVDQHREAGWKANLLKAISLPWIHVKTILPTETYLTNTYPTNKCFACLTTLSAIYIDTNNLEWHYVPETDTENEDQTDTATSSVIDNCLADQVADWPVECATCPAGTVMADDSYSCLCKCDLATMQTWQES